MGQNSETRSVNFFQINDSAVPKAYECYFTKKNLEYWYALIICSFSKPSVKCNITRVEL